jgi:hypothetical protein
VQDALSRCYQPLYDANRALLPCWQDLTEWASLLSVTVQPGPPQENPISRQKKRARRA